MQKDYKEKPYYISRVDPDGYFELNYLAAGDYNLVAFQDDNQNSIYDSGKERVAFLPEPLHLTEPKKDYVCCCLRQRKIQIC